MIDLLLGAPPSVSSVYCYAFAGNTGKSESEILIMRQGVRSSDPPSFDPLFKRPMKLDSNEDHASSLPREVSNSFCTNRCSVFIHVLLEMLGVGSHAGNISASEPEH